MAKELTHILIAQDVLKKLKGSGQLLLAQVIERNLPAFYLGAIIPDAFFYDVPPFPLSPQKYIWISRNLHLREKAQNDQVAVSFFGSIAANPCAWRLKVAFAAGVITHTVSDRILHEVIDYYTTTWGQKDSLAVATHRQIETLIDMVLVQQLHLHPRDFYLERLIHLERRPLNCLFRFYLAHLGVHLASGPWHLNALKRALVKQCLFLKLFTQRALYHTIKVSNKLAADRLRTWFSLFYPDHIGPQTFPILDKIDLNALTDGHAFTGTVTSIKDAAIADAIRHINIGLKRFA
ncbi:MAG: zinc dependent phospholipase C family protein [Deltaproteobacteria bacterium]|nr:zinc dependent phospholipase C family protein [Deltaproteobacteria bacterium]MBW2020457.1 zinc dependent phospholipase C family protein [Deltaproteobacteria bacterium]MBW2074474.1 zinc dependent phospholipase C family protein [Deltaproteobacteria bacterium]